MRPYRDPRLQCRECRAVLALADLMVSPHPFRRGETVEGCPRCREILDAVRLCDEGDCREEATCGTPTGQGYRWMCGPHYDKARREAGES